jgi:hypothetical protein
VASYRSPGVYLKEAAERRFAAVDAVPMSVTAFLGIAQRGPVYVPRRLTSFSEFREIYGASLPYAFLAESVSGFFANGGRECYVTRIAHVADGDPESARAASVVTLTAGGEEFLAITAASEGTWGDRIKVEIAEARYPTSSLAIGDVPVGATAVRVKSTYGFGLGDVVEIADREVAEHVVLTAVAGDELRWLPPARARFDATGPTRLTAREFRLVLSFESTIEEFDHLSTDPRSDKYVVNVVNARSRLVRAVDRRPHPELADGPAPTEVTLSGGHEGLGRLTGDDFVGFSEGPGARRGLGALEDIDDIGLVAVPDLMAAPQLSSGFGPAEIRAVQAAMVGACERRKDRFAILDAPCTCDTEEIREWRRGVDTKYAALYHPWLRVTGAGGRGGVRTIPPSGHVAGVYARCDRERGIHKAPANELLEEVVGLDRTLSLELQGLLTHEHVNCLRAFPGRGIRVWGARTLSSDEAWRYVNVRRLVTMIERSIEEGTQWAVFEDNTPELWKQVIRSISGFLRELTRRGFLVGETDEEAFYVKCDEETNPPEVVDAGQLVCEIGVAPVRPAEFIVFRIGQRTEDPILE